VPGNGKNAEEWSSKDKFGVVLETAGLNEAELAEYCRRKGLFIEQIVAWRAACQEANAHTAERTRDQREQSKTDRKRIKQLEKELLRKEKALAEAAALIILRKKGSSRITGISGFYLEEEEGAVAVTVGHPLHHFDPIVDSFELARVHGPADAGNDPPPVGFQFLGKLL
jgi:hypothetical protein